MVKLTLVIGVMAFGLVIYPASAKARRAAQAQAVTALEACRQMENASARLACYDSASARFSEAVARKELLVLDQQEVKETRRSLFGFSLPSLPLFRGDKAEEQDEITATIASVAGSGMGKWQIKLDTGAVWQTTDASEFLSPPKPGQKAVIRKGALGNYFIRFNGGRAVRGRRVS